MAAGGGQAATPPPPPAEALVATLSVSRSRAQPLGHRDEQPVPRRVAEAVVDDLEPVEVEEQHGERVAPLAAGARQMHRSTRSRNSTRFGSPVSPSCSDSCASRASIAVAPAAPPDARRETSGSTPRPAPRPPAAAVLRAPISPTTRRVITGIYRHRAHAGSPPRNRRSGSGRASTGPKIGRPAARHRRTGPSNGMFCRPGSAMERPRAGGRATRGWLVRELPGAGLGVVLVDVHAVGAGGRGRRRRACGAHGGVGVVAREELPGRPRPSAATRASR